MQHSFYQHVLDVPADLLQVSLFGVNTVVFQSSEDYLLVLNDAHLVVFQNGEFEVKVGQKLDVLGCHFHQVYA